MRLLSANYEFEQRKIVNFVKSKVGFREARIISNGNVRLNFSVVTQNRF